ncbi:PadR family transcriptional regulator [Bogoriella caseilytica]|uniref:PadR family transcriptional regulator n=2 Tax=Bogoriella caseilytica TaxID=56055 RepID=A0A3N2BEF0_9MICO|nr:PadR family transcriptional regulator [Bogoriella caseilytica]
MLVLVLLDEQDSYGYELVTRLRAAGLEEVSGGSVYPVLTRLERDAQLTSYLVQSSAGPARKYYSTTPAGLALLEQQRQDWQHLTAVVHAVSDPEEVAR